MKKINYQLKIAAFVLCILCSLRPVKAQFVNGNFSVPPSVFMPYCSAGGTWVVSPLNKPYYVYDANPWVNLTNCTSSDAPGFGTGAWIKQNVTTVANKWYKIQLDLGTLAAWEQFDASVYILINGETLHGPANRLFNNTFGTSSTVPSWKRVTSCMFMATSNLTTVQIVGWGMNPLYPGYTPPNPGPAGVCVDNITLLTVGDNVLVAESSGDCNGFCFSVAGPALSIGAITNIEWYIDNVLQPETTTTFCRKFPTGISQQVKVKFVTSNNCSGSPLTFTQTITKDIVGTQKCCDISGFVDINVERTDCNKYKFTPTIVPGYVVSASQWSLDGASAGVSPALELSPLLAGTHVICANITGAYSGDPKNVCSTKICKTVVVSAPSTSKKTIQFCPINSFAGPLYDPCNDCNGGYFKFVTATGDTIKSDTPGLCGPQTVSNTSVLLCYDILPNGKKCPRSTTTFVVNTMNVNGISSPDQTIYICEPSISYAFGCGPSYTHYKVQGPGINISGAFAGIMNLNLTPGDYTMDCINYTTCSINRKTVHVVQTTYQVSECSVNITSCGQQMTDDVNSFIDLVNCTGCRTILQGATIAGPWVFQSYNPNVSNGLRIITREYRDPVNCKKCIVTFSITNAKDPANTQTITANINTRCAVPGIPECMMNKTIKSFIVGHPENTTTINTSGVFLLCCQNAYGIQNPTYMLYSDEDPCCFALVTVNCSELPPVDPGTNTRHVAPGAADTANGKGDEANENGNMPFSLSIVPNPASSVFKIASDKGYEAYEKVDITDMNGKVLMTKTEINSQTLIDVSKFDKGTYFVNVKTKYGTVTLKLISISE